MKRGRKTPAEQYFQDAMIQLQKGSGVADAIEEAKREIAYAEIAIRAAPSFVKDHLILAMLHCLMAAKAVAKPNKPTRVQP